MYLVSLILLFFSFIPSFAWTDDDSLDGVEITITREAGNVAEEANAVKSIFLANMSHEIRTPMNAVLGYAQILERNYNLDHESKVFVKNILNSGNHLMNLIDEILDLSKIEAGKMELNLSGFDLNDFVREMSNMFEFRCNAKSLDWVNEAYRKNPIWVIGDETKLRQVLSTYLAMQLNLPTLARLNSE
jgi:signal transduction histidine kinase